MPLDQEVILVGDQDTQLQYGQGWAAFSTNGFKSEYDSGFWINVQFQFRCYAKISTGNELTVVTFRRFSLGWLWIFTQWIE